MKSAPAVRARARNPPPLSDSRDCSSSGTRPARSVSGCRRTRRRGSALPRTPPRPRGAAGRVAGRAIHRHRNRTHSYHVAGRHDLNVRDGRHRQRHCMLRIVVARRASHEDTCTGFTHEDARARRLLQCRNAARVVEMSVRIENDLHVGRSEAQRLNIRQNQGRRVWQSAVDQNMAIGRRDEDRGEAVRTDVVGVSVQVNGSVGRVPLGTTRTFSFRIRLDEDGILRTENGRARENGTDEEPARSRIRVRSSRAGHRQPSTYSMLGPPPRI